MILFFFPIFFSDPFKNMNDMDFISNTRRKLTFNYINLLKKLYCLKLHLWDIIFA